MNKHERRRASWHMGVQVWDSVSADILLGSRYWQRNKSAPPPPPPPPPPPMGPNHGPFSRNLWMPFGPINIEQSLQKFPKACLHCQQGIFFLWKLKINVQEKLLSPFQNTREIFQLKRKFSFYNEEIREEDFPLKGIQTPHWKEISI